MGAAGPPWPCKRHHRGRNACGVPHARPVRPEGLAPLPRHDDVRRADPRRRGRAHRRGVPRAGINFIDTANAYTEGRSEEVVGRAIARDRDAWVLATKVANAMGPGRTTAACPAPTSCRPARPASSGSTPTGSISTTSTRRTTRRRFRDRAGDGRPDPGRQGALLRGLPTTAPGGWPRSAASATSTASTGRRRASPITTPSTDAGGRAPAGLRPLRARRRALFAARPRPC